MLQVGRDHIEGLLKVSVLWVSQCFQDLLVLFQVVADLNKPNTVLAHPEHLRTLGLQGRFFIRSQWDKLFVEALIKVEVAYLRFNFGSVWLFHSFRLFNSVGLLPACCFQSLGYLARQSVCRLLILTRHHYQHILLVLPNAQVVLHYLQLDFVWLFLHILASADA